MIILNPTANIAKLHETNIYVFEYLFQFQF